MRITHHARERKALSAKDNKLPQETVSIGSPMPMKLKVDSKTMAERIFITAMKRIEETYPGAKWENNMRKNRSPYSGQQEHILWI